MVEFIYTELSYTVPGYGRFPVTLRVSSLDAGEGGKHSKNTDTTQDMNSLAQLNLTSREK
jgi:hypothetical protein